MVPALFRRGDGCGPWVGPGGEVLSFLPWFKGKGDPKVRSQGSELASGAGPKVRTPETKNPQPVGSGLGVGLFMVSGCCLGSSVGVG